MNSSASLVWGASGATRVQAILTNLGGIKGSASALWMKFLWPHHFQQVQLLNLSKSEPANWSSINSSLRILWSGKAPPVPNRRQTWKQGVMWKVEAWSEQKSPEPTPPIPADMALNKLELTTPSLISSEPDDYTEKNQDLLACSSVEYEARDSTPGVKFKTQSGCEGWTPVTQAESRRRPEHGDGTKANLKSLITVEVNC